MNGPFIQTPDQALAMAKEHVPDVAVLDFAMPELNGLEATRRIVARWPDPPEPIRGRSLAGLLREETIRPTPSPRTALRSESCSPRPMTWLAASRAGTGSPISRAASCIDKVMPAVTGHLNFHARVAANVIASVRREIGQSRTSSNHCRYTLVQRSGWNFTRPSRVALTASSLSERILFSRRSISNSIIW